ncbi:hypothetical protein B0H14DRAFT_3109212 [Mycena olivaceomarginata]|nr:hypothetical protein B0H14DRAFT_3109212 [Mycena olivaceomarginata]
MSPQTWLVTGASNGMGLSVTEYLLAEGHNIVAAVRKPESMGALKAKYGTRILVVKVNVQNQEDVDAAYTQAKEHFGRIDVVYNNAGYSAVGEAKDMFETNFFGATRVSLAAVKFFREVNKPVGGRLIQASSTYGIIPVGASGFYPASKHALEAISECMASELDPAWNIKAGSITLAEMGVFRTNLVKNHTFPVYTHPAYTAPTLLGNVTRAVLTNLDPEIIKGDPDKLARRLYELAMLDDPPMRVMLGADGPAMLSPKLARTRKRGRSMRSGRMG